MYEYVYTNIVEGAEVCLGPEVRFGCTLDSSHALCTASNLLSVALGNQHSSSCKERIPID